jgi:hypothetical protein
MNTIQIKQNKLILNYPDRQEVWNKSIGSLINTTSYISYNGYTYVLEP